MLGVRSTVRSVIPRNNTMIRIASARTRARLPAIAPVPYGQSIVFRILRYRDVTLKIAYRLPDEISFPIVSPSETSFPLLETLFQSYPHRSRRHRS